MGRQEVSGMKDEKGLGRGRIAQTSRLRASCYLSLWPWWRLSGRYGCRDRRGDEIRYGVYSYRYVCV